MTSNRQVEEAPSLFKLSFDHIMVRRQSQGAGAKRQPNVYATQDPELDLSRVQTPVVATSFTHSRRQDVTYFNTFYKYSKLSQKDARFFNRHGAPSLAQASTRIPSSVSKQPPVSQVTRKQIMIGLD